MKIGRGYTLFLVLLDEGQIWFPSTDNMCYDHHEYNLALNSPRIIVKWGLRFCKF